MAKKKPYSYSYTARANPRRYLLSGIPPSLWDRVRAKARKDHVAVRQVILSLLDGWAAGSNLPVTDVPEVHDRLRLRETIEGGPDKAD